VYASVARLAVLKFVNYMNASADVLALASVEVPINGIPEGGCVVIKYVAYSQRESERERYIYVYIYTYHVCLVVCYRAFFFF
jgi:hypothetical protein